MITKYYIKNLKMYSYTYYYFNCLFKKINYRKDYSFDSTGIVFLMQIFQIVFINGCFNLFFGFPLLPRQLSRNNYMENKIILMPILLIWLLVLFWHFNKKKSRIEAKFHARVKVDTKNTIFIFCLVVLPSVIACYLSFS